MRPSGIVTLLTDFGTSDPFVGVMKGVIASRDPELRVVDLTHHIERHALGDAAFWLAHSYSWFPPGTVHVVVVDPGVGSARRAVVMLAAGHVFVGPDNGVFELVARRAGQVAVRAVDTAALGLTVPSRTFHGRDVFAPVGAMLASGAVAFEAVGPLASLEATALLPEPELVPGAMHGAVVVIDRFGNLITNLPGSGARGEVALDGGPLRLVGTFADVASGEAAALVGSCGTVEVFVREGSAAERFRAKRGTRVTVSR